MSKQKKKVAVFGGSFNPPHVGHQKALELVRKEFPCDEIWLMPSGERADKRMAASSEHRMAMAGLLAKELESPDGPAAVVCPIEIERPEPTRTIDTFRELRKLHPEHDFHFIMSSEVIPDIRGYWEGGHELFSDAKFVIMDRPGAPTTNDIELPPSHAVVKPTEPLPDVSSTRIRTIANHDELSSLTPRSVADYIAKNRLYGFSEDASE